MLKFLLFFMIAVIVFLGMPFIGFGKSLEAVAADAARYFGIGEDEYEIRFLKKVVNAQTGEEVNGTHKWDFIKTEDGVKPIHSIEVQKSFSRPFSIATIFHEFAHAAQDKYDMRDSYGDFTREQHAELLAFRMLWRSGYWWNGTHMILMHTFRAKPKEYLVAGHLWNNALTGASPVSMPTFRVPVA